MSGLEKKFATKSKIVNYIINKQITSKVEIASDGSVKCERPVGERRDCGSRRI